MSQTPPARLRGRPARSSEQIEETRAHIAACALRLFQAEGFEAVSMRRLAQEAGCSPKTLYQYYDRKIDVLRDLWAEVFVELFDALDAVSARETRPLLRLDAVAFAYVEFWLKRRDRYFLVFMSSGVTQDDVSVFVADDPVLARFGLIRSCLAAALGEGARPAAIDLKNQVLLCALNGVTHNLITISAYPWAAPKKLVAAVVKGVLAA